MPSLWVSSVRSPPVSASLVLAQEEAGHVLVNHERDAACRGHSDQVGHHAFIEAQRTLVSAHARGKYASLMQEDSLAWRTVTLVISNELLIIMVIQFFWDELR